MYTSDPDSLLILFLFGNFLFLFRTDFGFVTLFCSLVHTAAHIARAVYENHLEGLYSERINLSGLVATLLLLPVAVPMMIGFMKNRVRVVKRERRGLICCLSRVGHITIYIWQVYGQCRSVVSVCKCVRCRVGVCMKIVSYRS